MILIYWEMVTTTTKHLDSDNTNNNAKIIDSCIHSDEDSVIDTSK
jgi:hypothetical protein